MRGVWFGLATLDVLALVVFLIIGELMLVALVGAFALIFFALAFFDHEDTATTFTTKDPRIDRLDDTIKALETRLESVEKNQKS